MQTRPKTHGVMLWLALVAAAAAMLLAGNNGTQLWDRDEPRYAQTAREMLDAFGSNWATPTYLGRAFPDKPPLLFWCQAGSMAAFGKNAGSARLPSVVATLLTLVVLTLVVWKTIGQRRALWTGFVFVTSLLVIVAGKMCLTDALLLLWVTIAQLALYAAYAGRAGPWTLAAMWVAVGLGVLTKLPVIIAVMGTTAIVLLLFDVGAEWRRPSAWLRATRWWWRTKPVIGVVIAGAIVTPWVYQVLANQKGGMIHRALAHDVWTRFTTPLEGHRGPPGYYLIATLVCFFPWVILLPLALWRAWQNRGLRPVRFALAAAIGPWLIFEVASTKLPAYVLPVYPALAFLTADFIVRCLRGQYAHLKGPDVLRGAVIIAVVMAALSIAPWLAAWPRFGLEAGPAWSAALVSAAAIAFGGVVLWLFLRRRPRAGFVAIGAGMMLFTTALVGVYLPRATFLTTSARIGDYMVNAGATRPGDVIMYGYTEPSLAFYQGGTIREVTRERFFEAPPEKDASWLVLTAPIWDGMSEDRRKGLEVMRTFRAWNYSSHGRLQEVMVVRRIGAQSAGAAASRPDPS